MHADKREERNICVYLCASVVKFRFLRKSYGLRPTSNDSHGLNAMTRLSVRQHAVNGEGTCATEDERQQTRQV